MITNDFYVQVDIVNEYNICSSIRNNITRLTILRLSSGIDSEPRGLSIPPVEEEETEEEDDMLTPEEKGLFHLSKFL